MTNPELSFEKKERYLRKIVELVKNAPQGLQAEFERTGNSDQLRSSSWLECLQTRLAALIGCLGMISEMEINKDNIFAQAESELWQLNDRVKKLKRQYPTQETDLPEELKQELLAGLNILSIIQTGLDEYRISLKD